MPSAAPRVELAIRPRPSAAQVEPPRKLKHAPCTSLPSDSPLSYLEERPAKRPMPAPSTPTTIAVCNSSGRQAASFIRVASAVGYHVRAQLRNLDGIVASEIASLPNVTVLVGDLYIKGTKEVVHETLIKDLFNGADLAFINTTFWGDEVAIGKALADAAVAANIKHYIYSSMPDHSKKKPEWPAIPLWSAKYEVETYIRSLPLLAPRTTYLYTGIYNNNFTSLPYPLFCMELQSDGSFLWEAPFHPNVPLPWLDAEHDVGPAVLQLIKDWDKWAGQKIALAFEMLTPKQACAAFSRGVRRPVRYRRTPKIDVKVKIPTGYHNQLLALEKLYNVGKDGKQPPYFGSDRFEQSCPEEALALWEGYRGLEEYAKEVFPLEEAANGLKWMEEDNILGEVGERGDDDFDSDNESEGITIGGGTDKPARKEETWLA
ncbi:NmrA-like family-domain-containing protein [Calycina marina]|uniref:NmrA-like family-domain-containing protein n=1 Tax=Calycina marina TaxID=1763456 RepID=A0A9P7Z639_9HELO|nr:NmrA-like family-domain-containing protein [Calycina marina]